MPLLAVAVIAAVFGLAIHNNLQRYGGNWSGFVVFGSHFASHTHPPEGAVVLTGPSRNGYDGQFYYVLARDPLLLHASTLSGLAGQTFRAGRIGYPALARAATDVTGVTLPFALVAVNVVIVLLLVGTLAWYAPRRGWSPWWALVVGLFPGFLLATLRDLTDPLATAAGVLGLLLWARGRRWWAAGFLCVAVLSREVMVLAVAAVLVDIVVRTWPSRRVPGVIRRLLPELVPALIPGAVFAAWQGYVTLRNGSIPKGAGTMFPFTTFARDIHDAFQTPPPSFTHWDLLYEAIVIIGVIVALTTIWRRPNVFSIAAALFAFGLSVGAFEPVWSDTRDSLPLLSMLLLAGLQDRRRLNLAICLSAAATTAIVPLAIPGIFSG
jgi:hypothetical protein